MRRFVALVIAVVLSSSSALADFASGPGEGNAVEKFKVTVAAGESSGKEMDFVTERKDKPTVFVFVAADKFSRPMARFIKVLDDKLKAERTNVDIIAVWRLTVQKRSGRLLFRTPRASVRPLALLDPSLA